MTVDTLFRLVREFFDFRQNICVYKYTRMHINIFIYIHYINIYIYINTAHLNYWLTCNVTRVCKIPMIFCSTLATNTNPLVFIIRVVRVNFQLNFAETDPRTYDIFADIRAIIESETYGVCPLHFPCSLKIK